MGRSTIGGLLAAALLAPLSPTAAAQPPPEADTELEQVLAGSADSTAEHEALARHYRARAANARERAEAHRWMATHYGGSLEPAIAAKQQQHCAGLARAYDGQARVFDQLAQAHEEAAASE